MRVDQTHPAALATTEDSGDMLTGMEEEARRRRRKGWCIRYHRLAHQSSAEVPLTWLYCMFLKSWPWLRDPGLHWAGAPSASANWTKPRSTNGRWRSCIAGSRPCAGTCRDEHTEGSRAVSDF